jgi:hypothetical protein
MIDTPLPEPDACEELLRRGSSPSDRLFREALLRRTRRVLRRRLWLRRAGVAAALAACFAAGLFTGRLGNEPVPVPETHPAPQAQAHSEPATAATAAVLEWQAVDSKEPRADLYRQAGDRYEDDGDYQSALRCYRGALGAGSDKDLAIAPDDSWLLMVLKDARQKEKRDASPNQ